jgi:type IV secretion system protein VirB6
VGFFAEFAAWLDGLLATFVTDQTARVTAALEPAVLILGSVYVLIWGVLQAAGQIEEPLIEGARRIGRLILVIGIGLHLWLYGPLIVNTFFYAPNQLAAVMIGAQDAVTIVDKIIFQGGDVAAALMAKGGILDGNLSYYIAGFLVYALIGVTAVYTIFLLSLAKVALSILLALGPLFLATLLFRTTHRYFEAWIAQLSHYGFVALLTSLIVSLLLHLLTTATAQAAAVGTGLTIAGSIKVCMAAGLIVLILRQVNPMASSLAGGVALSTHNVLSRSLHWSGQELTQRSLPRAAHATGVAAGAVTNATGRAATRVNARVNEWMGRQIPRRSGNP